MKEPCFTIYCHTCTVTGKSYVGQTTKTMEKRWRRHVISVHSRRKCRLLASAIQEYGVDAWTHVVLDVVSTRKDANAAEKYWVKQCNSLAPNGYNLTAGGSRDTAVSDETRQRIRESWTRRTPEQRAKTGRWRTPEKRSEVVRAGWAKKTPEQRSEPAKKRVAAKTSAQRSESLYKRWTNKTKEERSEIARSQRALLTDERRAARDAQLQAAARAKRDTETTEQRSERIRKGWETRRKNGHGGDGARKAWETRRARYGASGCTQIPAHVVDSIPEDAQPTPASNGAGSGSFPAV